MNNRYHCRYPWEKRDIQRELENLYDVDNETRISVRKTLSSEKGFTGTSILHKYLYLLCGFDIHQHMVIDVFHTVPLNLCKNQIQRMLELELLDTTDLDEKLKTFPWTSELKNGRIPAAVGKEGKGLGFWKAEGFQKFFFPVLECLLEGKLQDLTVLEIVCSISRFVELHFTSGRDGWNDDMIEMHRKLAQRINVKIEEAQGLDMCTISVHNMTHVHEDIINFSATDNYWCAVFERAVKEYVKRSHNCKGVEVTFARAECRREFLKSLQEQEDDNHCGECDTTQVWCYCQLLRNTYKFEKFESWSKCTCNDINQYLFCMFLQAIQYFGNAVGKPHNTIMSKNMGKIILTPWEVHHRVFTTYKIARSIPCVSKLYSKAFINFLIFFSEYQSCFPLRFTINALISLLSFN